MEIVRVLVLEDYKAMGQLISRYVLELNSKHTRKIHLDFAHSIPELEEKLKLESNEPCDYDVVVLDDDVHNEDPIQGGMAQKIRDQYENIRIAFFSSQPFPGLADSIGATQLSRDQVSTLVSYLREILEMPVEYIQVLVLEDEPCYRNMISLAAGDVEKRFHTSGIEVKFSLSFVGTIETLREYLAQVPFEYSGLILDNKIQGGGQLRHALQEGLPYELRKQYPNIRMGFNSTTVNPYIEKMAADVGAEYLDKEEEKISSFLQGLCMEK